MCVVERRLQMALDCISGPPDMKRLVFVEGRAGEAHRAFWQIERVGVKLEHLDVGREGPEDRVAAGSLAEEDRIDTQVGLRTTEDARAERARQQLDRKSTCLN